MEASSDDLRIELGSYANMVVLESNFFVFESTGRTCNVQPFSTNLGVTKNIPIANRALAYDCPYSGIVYILLVRNALYVPSIDHNLIPPFMIRAGGIIINNVPKIQYEDSVVDDHYIFIIDSDLQIPL